MSRAVTGHYVPVLLFGALHQVIPDRVMAGAGSPLWAVQQTGLRADGRPYTNIFFFNGGMGATPTKDGEHVLSWPSNISSTPVEVAERNSPLFFREKRPDRGLGRRRALPRRARSGHRLRCASRTCRSSRRSWPSARSSRRRASRAAATAASATCKINGVSIDNRRQHVLKRGDVVLVRTPGAGGYGPAAERDPAAAERDHTLGY